MVTATGICARLGLSHEILDPDDIVLIAGKGHEPWQEIAGERRPFDDSRHARSALEAWSC